MSYKALLFCPDERTAKTVTQVLSELEFQVEACNEPFGAVKKLMAGHFDAVVVDCDNEQNATLLFKSARNSEFNQASLSVAVVEGQSGVAKAFRIGANLVLTKPINVEQAKGTLRVARGLLRKNEAAKPVAAAASAATKPAAPAATPAKLALVPPSVTTPRPAAPVAPRATTIPAQNQTPQPSFSVSASSATTEAAESAEAIHAGLEPVTTSAAPIAAPKIAPAAESRPEIIARPEAPPPSGQGFSLPSAAGAASAAARARDAEPHVPATDQTSTAIAEPESPVQAAASVSASPVAEAASSSSAPTLTFGGMVGSGTESAGGGSKKTLLIVAAVVLVAACGYYAWTQWAHLNGTPSVSTPVVARPATAAPAVPQAAPNPAAIAPSPVPSTTPSAPDSGTSSGTSAVPSSATPAQPTAPATASLTVEPTPSADNTPAHQSKVNPSMDSSKPSASVVAASKAPAKAAPVQPMVIKNGASRPAVANAEPTADAPSITGMAPAGNGGSLPNLMASPSQTEAPVLQVVNVSQGVSEGLVIKKTPPSYPLNSLIMRVEGPVELQATISKTGDISAVKILSGDAGLARAAVDAVKQWKYKPYLLDGSPVEIQTQITVNFKLPQ